MLGIGAVGRLILIRALGGARLADRALHLRTDHLGVLAGYLVFGDVPNLSLLLRRINNIGSGLFVF